MILSLGFAPVGSYESTAAIIGFADDAVKILWRVVDGFGIK
jgi:hypothetical protein